MNVRGSRDKDGSYLDDQRRHVRSEKVWAAQRARSRMRSLRGRMPASWRRCGPRRNEVAAVRESRGPKSDKLDAFGLAEQLRIGAIKRKVYKKRGEFGELRHRAKAYTLLVSDSVRVQNRIKSLFRSRGVAVAGKGVLSATRREE
jgi:hypothetical protein